MAGGAAPPIDPNLEFLVTLARGPVFVAGLERSGTSLMFALLASHPAIAMTRRTNLWTHFYDQYGDLASPENLDRCLGVMMRYRRLLKLEPNVERLRTEFLAGAPTYPRLFALLEQQYAERVGRPRWGDKSLHTERYAVLIFEAYDGARILHMMRDPRDRFASSKTRWGARRGGVGAGTAEWLSSARLGLCNRQRFPQQYRIVRYESLVTEPERTVRELCEFIGEDFVPEMLVMHGGGSFIDKGGNSSYGTKYEGVISPASVGRYRGVLTRRQIAFMQMLGASDMAKLGYDLDQTQFSLAGRVRYAVGDVPLETARLLAWRAREAVHNSRGRPVPAYRLVECEAT